MSSSQHMLLGSNEQGNSLQRELATVQKEFTAAKASRSAEITMASESANVRIQESKRDLKAKHKAFFGAWGNDDIRHQPSHNS